MRLAVTERAGEFFVSITHEGRGAPFQYEAILEGGLGSVAFFSRLSGIVLDAQHCYDRDWKFYEGVK